MKKKTTDFAEYYASYMTMYLPGQKGLSECTIDSYRYTFKLIFDFTEEKLGVSSERITLKLLNCEFVESFLNWLENERGNSIATRNQRLTAIRSFVRYAKKRKPEYLFECQKILEIDSKKKPKPELGHLTPDAMQDIISRPKGYDKWGRRDIVLLSLMYDCGGRVSEICDLCVKNVRLQKPYTVTLIGKNRKTRSVPIMESTVKVLKTYLTENQLLTSDKGDYPLFTNHQHNKLTRAGIAYILKKYCDAARKDGLLIPAKISPHILRHSKAMHMLQAGLNLIYIRDFLGHEQIETTEIYAKADTEMKRKAIEAAQICVEPNLPDWAEDKALMAMLMNMQNKG